MSFNLIDNCEINMTVLIYTKREHFDIIQAYKRLKAEIHQKH